MLHKLGKKFANKAGICIDINEIFSTFHLHDVNFKQDPAYHTVVLASMKAQKTLQGPSRVFLSDPANKFRVKKAFNMPSDPDEEDPDYITVSGSPCVAFTEQDLGKGRRGFGLIIRQNAEDQVGLRTSMIFGMYGTYDKTEQKLYVERLYTPEFGEGNTITEAREIPVSAENVRGALFFAMLCADKIYSKEPFNPRECFQIAVNEDLDEMPTPEIFRFEP